MPLPQYNYFKVTPPSRKVALPRERLVARLSADGLAARLTVVCAEAGYGKTTLLRQFTDATTARVAWYRLGGTDRDPVQFIAYLVETLQQQWPGIGPDLATVTGDVSASADPLFAAFAIAHTLRRLPDEPFVVILDNYEKVSGSRVVASLVQGLLEYLPPAVHLFIATRQRPDLPLGRLRADGELCEIGQSDLAFTDEEIQAFMARIDDLSLQPKELATLSARTEGWPAGIVMAAQHLRYRQGESLLQALVDLSGGSKAIYDYLAEEVFASLDPSVQSFLLKTAILSQLSTEVCNQLLGIGNAQQVLIGLEDCGLFTHSAGERRELFRYHRLFREFLLTQLRLHLDPREACALHLRAAEILKSAGSFAEALEQYSAAGELDAAADLVERLAEQYMDCGMIDTVQHWLSIIPEAVLDSRPWLMTLRARMLRRIGEYSPALALLQQANRQFCSLGDTAGQVAVIHEIGFTNYRLGRFSETAELAEEVLRDHTLETADLARVLATLCLSYKSMDELAKSIECGGRALNEIAQMPHDDAAATLATRVHRFLARARARQGHLNLALPEAEKALAVTQRYKVGDIEIAWAHFTRGQVLYLSGELDEGIKALQESESAGGLNRSWQRQRINLWLGCAWRDKGDVAQATLAFDHAGPLAISEHAFLLLRQQQLGEAMALAQEAYRFFEARQSPGDLAIARTTLALVLKGRGQVDLARRHLEAARAVFADRGIEQRMVSATLQLAYLEFMSGDANRATALLRKAADQGALREYRHLNWWDPAVFTFMAGQALKLGIQPHFVCETIRFKLRRGHSTEIVGLLSFPDGSVQDTVARIFEEVARDAAASRDLADGLLAACQDKQLRNRILTHVSSGILSVDEFAQLHSRYGLTWREIDVFCQYYLQAASGKQPQGLGRQHFARQLCMSENTLKVHINSIRRKLGMVERSAGMRGAVWVDEGRRVL